MLVLAGVGRLIGFTIEGSNVKIPAHWHYHGSVVGVTPALMGVVHLLLPRLGFGAPDVKLATLRPCLFGPGQFVHVGGLLWSGGYGVQRKTAGTGHVEGENDGRYLSEVQGGRRPGVACVPEPRSHPR